MNNKPHEVTRPVTRDELLARVDLSALADEILGPGRGQGLHRTWPCPAHRPQTGRTPPVSIFTTTRGEQRWHCHACGAGGTAIDLLVTGASMSVRAAFDALAARAQSHPVTTATHSRRGSGPAPRPVPAGAPHPVVAAHVRRCAALLWTTRGEPIRAWLHARGFTDDTLRANLLGADPGPRQLDRARGLPCHAPAAILPVLREGEPVYFQARYLDPDRAGRKYDNPLAALAPNPRLAGLEPSGVARSDTLFVCEGLPDALSITQSGYRAVAVLGVGLAGTHVAERLHDAHADSPLRVAFDTDARGIAVRDALLDELHELGHPNVAAFALPTGCHDVNEWLNHDPVGLAHALDISVHSVAPLELGIDLDL